MEYERMLQRLDVHVGERVVDAVLEAGYTNRVYRVSTDCGKYIYRELGCYREEEDRISRLVGGARIIASNREYRIERCVENMGASLDRDFWEIAREMRRFHGVEVDGVEDFESMVGRYVEEASLVRGDAADLLGCIWERMRRVPETRYFGRSLCHNDLHAGNILKTADGLVFIDFDVAAMGNPCVDIANVFCESMYDCAGHVLREELGWSREQRRAFVEAYAGEDGDVEQILKEAEEAVVHSHFLWYLWSICRRNGSEFRYLEYGRSRLFFLHRLGMVDDKEHAVLRSLD